MITTQILIQQYLVNYLNLVFNNFIFCILFHNHQMKTTHTFKSRGMSQVIDIQEEPITIKANTNTDGFHFLQQEEQLKKYKKMVKDLQRIVKEQREKREEMQQKVSMLQTRNVQRQKQFHNVLKKNLDVFSKIDKKDEQSKNAQIMKVFDRIFENFDDMNNATSSFVEKRYSENMKTMETRINNIMMVLNQELSKSNKIRNLDRLDLQKSIEQVLFIAKKIEEQNFKTKQKLQSETLKIRLLKEQKQLLIEEVVQKKQLIFKLYLQNKKLKEQIHRSQNDININSLTVPCKNNISSVSNQEKQFTLKDRGISQVSTKKIIRVSQFELNPSLKQQQFITEANQKMNQPVFATKSRYNSTNRTSNLTDRHLSRSLNYNKKQTQKQQKVLNRGTQMEKVVQHYKLSLQRQKKKCQQLSKLLNKLQFQNQQINSSISQIIKEYKKQNKDGKALEVLVKSQKLFQIIRSLKQRLLMVQRPSFTCGWGDNVAETQFFGLVSPPTSQIKDTKVH